MQIPPKRTNTQHNVSLTSFHNPENVRELKRLFSHAFLEGAQLTTPRVKFSGRMIEKKMDSYWYKSGVFVQSTTPCIAVLYSE